jgi:hypothetical protein
VTLQSTRFGSGPVPGGKTSGFFISKITQFLHLTGFDASRSGAIPLSSRPLNFGRNSLLVPTQVQFDLRVLKFFKVGSMVSWTSLLSRLIFSTVTMSSH